MIKAPKIEPMMMPIIVLVFKGEPDWAAPGVDDEVDDEEVGEPDVEGTEDDRGNEVGLDENEDIGDDVRADEDDTEIEVEGITEVEEIEVDVEGIAVVEGVADGVEVTEDGEGEDDDEVGVGVDRVRDDAGEVRPP